MFCALATHQHRQSKGGKSSYVINIYVVSRVLYSLVWLSRPLGLMQTLNLNLRVCSHQESPTVRFLWSGPKHKEYLFCFGALHFHIWQQTLVCKDCSITGQNRLACCTRCARHDLFYAIPRKFLVPWRLLMQPSTFFYYHFATPRSFCEKAVKKSHKCDWH